MGKFLIFLMLVLVMCMIPYSSAAIQVYQTEGVILSITSTSLSLQTNEGIFHLRRNIIGVSPDEEFREGEKVYVSYLLNIIEIRRPGSKKSNFDLKDSLEKNIILDDRVFYDASTFLAFPLQFG